MRYFVNQVYVSEACIVWIGLFIRRISLSRPVAIINFSPGKIK